GIVIDWAASDLRPEVSSFEVFNRLPSSIDGVFATGFITDLLPAVEPGPRKIASLSASGPLHGPSRVRVTPPVSALGQPTGRLVGAMLGRSGCLSPPGSIASG